MRDLEITEAHKHDRPDFLKPLCWGVFGLLAGAIAFRFLRPDDDRPPIIVRGGSARFQNDWGWDDAGGEWKTRQTGARKVKYFTALVNGKPCGLQKAPQLNITYQSATGRQETFKVIHRGGDPRILPGGLLEQDSYYDTIVHDGDNQGRLLKIAGPPNPHNQCELAKDAVIRISYEYQ